MNAISSRICSLQITTAQQALLRDQKAILAGRKSIDLMISAGTETAAAIMSIASHRLAEGVVVMCGGGNNGGDGWITAAQLARMGISVRVLQVKDPRSDDAKLSRDIARRYLRADYIKSSLESVKEVPGIIVDALLGTGACGPLKEEFHKAAIWCRKMRDRGVFVVSADIPTGVSSDTGECSSNHIEADLTIAYGTLKLGHVSARSACGRIMVVDIGLGKHAWQDDGAAMLATEYDMRYFAVDTRWNDWKGSKGRILLVGADRGMSGAVSLASKAALAVGGGMVQVSVHPTSLDSLQVTVAEAVATDWNSKMPSTEWAHAVGVGPGLGRGNESQKAFLRAIDYAKDASIPVVLDADALSLSSSDGFHSKVLNLARVCPVVLTPHQGEFNRLLPFSGGEILTSKTCINGRIEATRSMASSTGCIVLLKGAPTIVADPSGQVTVVPRGSTALATGGSGDILTGVVSALLASTRSSEGELSIRRAYECTILAAFVHGVAGELVSGIASSPIAIIDNIPRAWSRIMRSKDCPIQSELAGLPSLSFSQE